MTDPLHRPWPAPATPWRMEQVWHDLLFIHWPMPIEEIRRHVPSALTMDTFDGQAWLAVVPFRMSDIRWRGGPLLPGASAFPELNVRTYVSYKGKPGVYFFSLDAASVLAVLGARMGFRLPYYWSTMRCVAGEGNSIVYSCRRLALSPWKATFAGTYQPIGPVFVSKPGELLYWLTERYCLYTVQGQGQVWRSEIDHAPWPLQLASLESEENTMTHPLGMNLPSGAPLLHFSKRQDVRVWFPEIA